MTTTLKYIDTTYYTQNYKPHIQAAISGNYNNAERNAANFESFVQRASELINNLTGNTVENLGGITSLTPTPQNWIRRATAAMVEYWYLNDFNLNIINQSVSMGGVNISKAKTDDTKRALIPETVLVMIQNSGMAQQTFVGVNTEGELASSIPGLSVKDVLTVDEAFAFFQEKGNYDNNFHKSIEVEDELTDTVAPRYFLIGKSQPAQKQMTFAFLGGNEDNVTDGKKIVSIMRNASGTDISSTESAVVSLNPLADDTQNAPGEPEVLAKINSDDEIEVYIQTKVEFKKPHVQGINDILITDIVPGDDARYQLFSSSLQQPSVAILLPKKAAAQSATTTTSLQDQINALDTRVTHLDVRDVDTATGTKNLADITTHLIDWTKLTDELSKKSDVADITQLQTKVNSNTSDITKLNNDLTTVTTDKLDKTEALNGYISRDKGTNKFTSMKSGYSSTDNLDVIVKQELDTEVQTLNNDIGDVEARLTALESDTLTGDNFIDGNFALTATGNSDEATLDASAINGNNGPFDFSSGKTVEISVYDNTNGLGGSAKVVIGKTNPQTITLAGGGKTETVAITVDTSGMIKISSGFGTGHIANDIVVDRIAQQILGGISSSAVGKADLDKKQDKVINTFHGSATTVEGALNENKDAIDKNITDITTNADDVDTVRQVAEALGKIVLNNKADIEEIANDGKIVSDTNTRQLTLPNIHAAVLTDKTYLDAIGYEEVQVTSEDITVLIDPDLGIGKEHDFLAADKVTGVPLDIDLSPYDAIEMSISFANGNNYSIRMLPNNQSYGLTGGDPFAGAAIDNGSLNIAEFKYLTNAKQIELNSFEKLEWSGDKTIKGVVTWKHMDRFEVKVTKMLGYKLRTKTILAKK